MTKARVCGRGSSPTGELVQESRPTHRGRGGSRSTSPGDLNVQEFIALAGRPATWFGPASVRDDAGGPVIHQLVSQDVAASLLAGLTKRRNAFGEVFAERSRSLQVTLDDGTIDGVSAGSDMGFGVRLVDGPRMGYAVSTRLDEGGLQDAIYEAALAVNLPSAEIVPVPAPTRSEWDDSGMEHAPSGVRLLQRAEEAAHAVSPAVTSVAAMLKTAERAIHIVTSSGESQTETRITTELRVDTVAKQGGIIRSATESVMWREPPDLVTEAAAGAAGAAAANRAVALLASRPTPSGPMSVVLGPGGGGVLFHEACGHALEADLVLKGASSLADAHGRRIASDVVTVVDDGSLAGGPVSSAFDDEGVPAQRTAVIEAGHVVSFLWARREAGDCGGQSTGNGRRESYTYHPVPRMTNCVVLPGEDEPADVIADTQAGIYAAALLVGQVNAASGDFVFGVAEGYLIEHGKITHPVYGVNLAGNGREALTGVDAVCADVTIRHAPCRKHRQDLTVGIGSPTMRVQRLSIGGYQ